MQDRHYQLACILIALFCIIQLVILFLFGYTPYPDSNGYIQLAQESLQHGEAYPIRSLLHEYPFLWNIGAINITALSLSLFHTITPLLVIYALMKGISAWLFYSITNKVFDSRTAFIALVIYLIFPANYGESTSLLSELPFMFFILLGIYLSIVHNQSIFGGMMLALANWFRPMGIVFLLALLVFFLFKWRKSIKLVIGYIIMITIIGSTTMYRTGLFLYQAKTGWMALMDYSSDHTPETMAIRDRQDWNVSQKDSAWQVLFFDWLKDHPKEYIQQMPIKFSDTYVSDNINMCTFIPDKTKKEYMYEEVSMGTIINNFPRLSAVQWLTILNLIIYYAILITAIASLFFFREETRLLPITIIVLGTLLLLFAGHGEARFHQPFMPFFIMLSAIFINKRVWKG